MRVGACPSVRLLVYCRCPFFFFDEPNRPPEINYNLTELRTWEPKRSGLFLHCLDRDFAEQRAAAQHHPPSRPRYIRV